MLCSERSGDEAELISTHTVAHTGMAGSIRAHLGYTRKQSAKMRTEIKRGLQSAFRHFSVERPNDINGTSDALQGRLLSVCVVFFCTGSTKSY